MLSAAIVLMLPGLPAAPANLLWEIGKSDDDTAEFALARNRYNEFKEDGLFAVGLSDPKRDWPYVHPGPADGWAGGRSHTFSILFGIRRAAAGGECRLRFDLADTHSRGAPPLEIRIGGRSFRHDPPPGGSDESVFGNPAAGREHRFDVTFPADLLRAGTNEIAITTLSGSWILYDWIGLEVPAGIERAAVEETTLVHGIRAAPVLVRKDGKLFQVVRMTVRRFGEPVEATVEISGAEPVKVGLRAGGQTVDIPIPAVEAETRVAIEVKVGKKSLARREEILKPVRKWVVYLLPHSHVDIGYTKLQTLVEKDHWAFFEQAIEASQKTAGYPAGAQFKWNVEVLWALDGYLRSAPPEKREKVIDAIRKGWIGLDALYGNELTALCRPEELLRLVDLAVRLSKEIGVPIESAMISDVPGYTWGIVPALALAGVKYFSVGPNSGDRIGYTLEAWGDKPFWWIGPSGDRKVLCWVAGKGYYRGFGGAEDLLEYLRRLESSGYPYDIVQLRQSLGDNAGPGLDVSEVVKDWNERYAYPRLVIATTVELFRAFEARYGDKLPEASGDFTPYWEDGAASSAMETSMNRASAERLVQAEAIWAMTGARPFPADGFDEAWRNIILYDEHTWGAYNSISEPDGEFAKGQWKIKQAFAADAVQLSSKLLEDAIAPLRSKDAEMSAVLVINTNSWQRTDLIVLPAQAEVAGARVQDPSGGIAPSQYLTSKRLAFLAKDVPPFGAKRYVIAAGQPPAAGGAVARERELTNGLVTVAIDEKTGAIAHFTARSVPGDLVDAKSGMGLNDYLYVAGRDPKAAKRAGPPKISVGERGPLVASLLIESDAPGCRSLSREIRIVDGIEAVEIIDMPHKLPIREKEGVHFAFPFRVPDGVMRLDIPWAVVRPEVDQLPGACKNWFTVSRWVDVSNDVFGVTWATVDAPLVEIGAITAETPWMRTIAPSQTLYAYVMNNYWHTNYKADQEGPTPFVFAIRPHGRLDLAAAARFGLERSQPLIAVPVAPDAPVLPSLLRVEPDGVIVTSLKPSRDGKARIVRLFNATDRAAKASLAWNEPATVTWRSDLAEGEGPRVTGPIDIPAWGIVTLRASR